MKKLVLNLLLAGMALSFAACGDNEVPPVTTETPTLSTPKFVNNGLVLEVEEHALVPFTRVFLTESGTAVLGPFRLLRAQLVVGEYLVGTYTLQGDVYTIYDEGGKEYCKLIVKDKTAQRTIVTVQLAGMNEPVSAQASVTRGLVADEVISRSWTVAMTRVRHFDGVTAVHHFENAQEAASLNKILEYAKTKADIDEDFEEEMTIKEIVFTQAGTVIFVFTNGKHYVGKWNWKDASKGLLAYHWYDQKMGNKLENGEATFDIRAYKNVNYYTLTLGADVEHKSKKYKLELTFYLKELKR